MKCIPRKVIAILLGLLAAGPTHGASSGPTLSTTGSEPTTATMATTQVVEMAVGPAHLTGGSGVVIRGSFTDPQTLRQSVERVVRSIAPAAPTTPSTHLGLPMEVVLHWTTPGRRAWVRPLGPSIEPLPDLEPGVHEFYVVWKDPILGFEMRIPESPRAFRVEVEAAGLPSTVVDGSGTITGIFGETIPVWVKVREPSRIRSATIHARSTPQETATTRPMVPESASEGPVTFRGKIPRPAGADSAVEYWIELEDVEGRRPTYGSSTSPHKILLRQPTSQQ